MSVCLIWLGEPKLAEDVVAGPGPWREVLEAAPGLLVVDSDETLSRVYHEVKWRLPDDCALMVAPLAARPKSRGLAGGTVSWLRSRLDLPEEAQAAGTGAPGPAPQTTGFGPLRIAYDDRVLRPRQWTVGQARWAAQLLAVVPEGPVLELCTGAGQIGLSAVAGSDRHLVCVDADDVACQFAEHNAQAAGMSDRVEVRHGLMDEVVRDDERFALVVADPPWVRSSDVGHHPDDPRHAIDGGHDGLQLARTCVSVARSHLLPGGYLLLQLGSVDQARAIGAEAGMKVHEVRTYERGVVVALEPV